MVEQSVQKEETDPKVTIEEGRDCPSGGTNAHRGYWCKAHKDKGKESWDGHTSISLCKEAVKIKCAGANKELGEMNNLVNLLVSSKSKIVESIRSANKEFSKCRFDLSQNKLDLNTANTNLKSIRTELASANALLGEQGRIIEASEAAAAKEKLAAETAVATATAALQAALTEGSGRVSALQQELDKAKRSLTSENEQSAAAMVAAEQAAMVAANRTRDLEADKRTTAAAISSLKEQNRTFTQNLRQAEIDLSEKTRKLAVAEAEISYFKKTIEGFKTGILTHLKQLDQADEEIKKLGKANKKGGTVEFGKAWATYRRIHSPGYVRNAVAAFGKSLRKKR